MNEQYIRDNTILNVVHGSRAYGTNIPGSDYDEKGIVIIPDMSYYFGFNKFEQKDKGWEDGSDRVAYDIRKFFHLALQCNPNIIEVLFVEPEQILVETIEGKTIRSFRDVFLSRRASKTFSGYAMAQMRRLQNKIDAGKDVNWKHAMHLIRLLRMGIEIIRDGKVLVKRHDAQSLLKIRNGEVDLADIMNEAHHWLGEIDGMIERSPLPVEPDRESAERLMITLIKEKVFANILL